VDNLDYREHLKNLHAEAIGGEMEGIGLYVSAYRQKVDWILVKGICDWGHEKNRGDKNINQRIAAKSAATVVKAALDVRSGG
jgi:nucleoside phosphorylase